MEHTARAVNGRQVERPAVEPVVVKPEREPMIDARPWLVADGVARPSLSRCPLCLGEVVPVLGIPEFVRHRSALHDARCVLTTRTYQPDELVVRKAYDVAVGFAHRMRFVRRWEFHYAAVQQLCPSFTMKRFATVLAYADVLNLWSYPNLREEDLASVLLVLTGFMRLADSTGKGAPESVGWVRFWFDASVRDVGDLWSARTSAPGLFRIEYREPESTPFPTGADVLGGMRVDTLQMPWAERVAGPAPELHAADRAAFGRFVARSHRN
ncbi:MULTISPECIES: hypothetical protein [Paraburkholderia]|uniref:hypothetical protein n=1 Tax=Paraburkholderia TaxID=1822464 RepID=UPI00225581D8|nr:MULTISPECIES: hypothetical protein [Paraburkholderia]MCX4161686.1 hypothetical protein [Paraburkholderia megapolitana]MDN7157183.1 hypothetical protein [Paraburkholderia sp. CHISQ3]MDQ6494228.1 hypothetical protein [Paraburkholderia megapolitana]